VFVEARRRLPEMARRRTGFTTGGKSLIGRRPYG
jgi:hypothetical protein